MIAGNPWLTMALNNAWANATLYETVRSSPAELFSAPCPGFFPSLERTLNHIHQVDLYYLDALEDGGAGRSVFDRADIADPDHLARAQAEADMRFASFCRTADPTELRQTERASGRVTETVGAIILHLVQHQIHHRGQAHVQLSHAGIDPPQLDEFHLAFDRAPSAEPYWN